MPALVTGPDADRCLGVPILAALFFVLSLPGAGAAIQEHHPDHRAEQPVLGDKRRDEAEERPQLLLLAVLDALWARKSPGAHRIALSCRSCSARCASRIES